MKIIGTNSVVTVVSGLLLSAALSGCSDDSSGAPEPAASSAQPSGQATTGRVPFPMDATIPELQRALRNGRITAVELVNFHLARIGAYDDAGPALNALITVNPDARAEAAALDAELAESGPRGPLHGIPLVVKDNIDTAGMPTTAGTPVLEDFRPARDAFQVRRLRQAGAIIIAKANLAELAQASNSYSRVGGQTLMPYNTSFDPGGSSGGTAVAVTANFAVAGLGTDTCGSVRLPAGLNNIYGLRPTYGLSSRAGVVPWSAALDEVGPMARTIGDLAILMDVTAGEDPDDPITVPTQTSLVDALSPDGLDGRRIGILGFDYRTELDGTLQEALDVMVEYGAELVPVDLPEPERDPYPNFDEFPSTLAAYLAKEPTAPEGAWARIVGSGASPKGPSPRVFQRALAAARMDYRRDLAAFMDERDLDAVAYPVSATTASAGRLFGQDDELGSFNCATAAIAGIPALAIPAGFASDGLPVGLELLGRAFDEATLISIAAGFEAHTDHRLPPPTTPPLGTEP